MPVKIHKLVFLHQLVGMDGFQIFLDHISGDPGYEENLPDLANHLINLKVCDIMIGALAGNIPPEAMELMHEVYDVLSTGQADYVVVCYDPPYIDHNKI